jgi:hypothetical protein
MLAFVSRTFLAHSPKKANLGPRKSPKSVRSSRSMAKGPKSQKENQSANHHVREQQVVAVEELLHDENRQRRCQACQPD